MRDENLVPDLWGWELLVEDADGYGMQHVALGVDGGGTSTTCVVLPSSEWAAMFEDKPCNRTRRIVAEKTVGSSNHNSVGLEGAQRALETAISGALQKAAVPRICVDAVCFCLAGVDRSADAERVTQWARSILPSTVSISVHNDAVGALASGTGGCLEGCVLISGTGTIAYGASQDGRTARAAGAGPALGDRGSGFAIATEGLSAVMRADDGRGPPTALTEVVLKHLELSCAQDLITWAYADPAWARVAALAPLVEQCAVGGDAVADRIITDAVHELASSVHGVVRRLGLAGEDNSRHFPLVLIGGVLSEGLVVGKRLVEELRRTLAAAQPLHPEVSPAVGAALLALRDYQGKRRRKV